ncbi:MAG TPA: adenosine kinase [Candidatus Nanoarchaeia archaeon]|nr:adenosine kinase [Candidatus Nanoarchaeia archaeon]
MTKKVLGITHALTDQIIPVSDEELSSIDLTCGGWKPFSICANKKSLEELLKKESVKRYLGGAPTNVIRGLNNLGYDCNLIGNIGEDELGKNYINVLEEESINPLFHIYSGKKSGECYVFITPNKKRSFYSNASIADNFKDLDTYLSKNENFDLIFTSGYEFSSNPSKFIDFIQLLKQKGTKIAFDIANGNIAKKNLPEFKEMIKLSNVLFISDEESEIAFGGLQDWMFKDKICAYKKGTKGSEIYQNKNKAIIPCYKTDKLVNDNGAGDSYAAGFLHAYLENRDIELCGILASLIAKKVCQQEESWYKNNLS